MLEPGGFAEPWKPGLPPSPADRGCRGNAERQPSALQPCQCFRCLSVSLVELKPAAPALVSGAAGNGLAAFLFSFSTKKQSPSYPRNLNRRGLTESTVSVANQETCSLHFPRGMQAPETTWPLQESEDRVLLGQDRILTRPDPQSSLGCWVSPEHFSARDRLCSSPRTHLRAAVPRGPCTAEPFSSCHFWTTPGFALHFGQLTNDAVSLAKSRGTAWGCHF